MSRNSHMRSEFLISLLFFSMAGFAQPSVDLIRQDGVTNIEKILSADDMGGRQVYTTGIEKAAAFIAREFDSAGLVPMEGNEGYRQNFTVIKTKLTEAGAVLDGVALGSGQIIALTALPELTITQNDHYQKVIVKKAGDFRQAFLKYLDADKNYLILVDSNLTDDFSRRANFHFPQFEGSGNRIFILTSADPGVFVIHVKQEISKQSLTNIVGILPGKSLKNEYVIFSAHYDHLGIGDPDENADSIYNGANDDASGTTAIITLAKYFSMLHSNQRSLIFAAFTAEEIGEFGSAYFSKRLDPDKIAAMFNIEMIGTESKWGMNSAYITGFNKTDMGTVLRRNLGKTKFSFYPDPYPDQDLFYRSDNATLAKLGVPAHTISTSKMDSEPHYHKQSDEIETLDMKNMTRVIRAIAISAGTIISGKDTPERIRP